LPATDVRVGSDVDRTGTELKKGGVALSGRPARRPVELRQLLTASRAGWSRGQRPWVALGLSLATIVVYLLVRSPTVGTTVWRAGDVYAALPLATELRRLPMSLLLPTPYLPEWGAVAQLLVVIGLGELLLGRWLTVIVATVGHVGATLAARLALDVGQGTLLGLSPALARALDTGPSAAATAVGACVLVVVGMYRCTALLTISLLIAALVVPGIDGLEHMVALLSGLAVGVLYRTSDRGSLRH
jgi:hypothetical protein